MKSSNIGGQAVMEGIMMMNKDRYAIAVRRPDGGITVKTEQNTALSHFRHLRKLPFVRGVFSFVDSMVIGMKCLMYSASFFEEEETSGEEKEGGTDLLLYGTVALSVVLAVGIFMVLPYGLAELMRRFWHLEGAASVAEALLRVAVFLIYLAAISRMKDIQRVFMYHGAEHKCINCIEHGHDLTVENVLASSREHKRCGTSFLMYVVIISVIFFLFIRVESPWLRLLSRLALVPVIAGVAYEVIRLAGRSEHPLVQLISRPGLMLQHLTTREPDASMAEVAIQAVEAVFDWRAYLEENFPERERSGARAD